MSQIFEEGLKSLITVYKTNKQISNNSDGWDALKANIKDLAIQTSQIQRKNNKDIEDQLTADLNKLREIIEREDADEKDAERYEQVKYKLKVREEKREEGNRIRAKIVKFTNDEKPTKYYFQQEQKRRETKQINVLLDENDETLQDKDDVLGKVEDFYTTLYKTENFNAKQAEENLKLIKNRLSPDDNTVLNDEISEHEIRKAIWGMDNEKSPGEDGIPKEFYHKFFHLIKDELTEIYNNIKLEKKQPLSQKML